jgi:hypothetical protein
LFVEPGFPGRPLFEPELPGNPFVDPGVLLLGGNVDVPGLLLLLLFGVVDVPGFENGLLLKGLLLLLLEGVWLELLFGLVNGLENGLVDVFDEVDGVGAEIPTLGCCVGPAVVLPLHRPNVQVSPMPHMLLHDPQLSLSLVRSAHPPKQRVCPCAHEHFPLTHDDPPPVHGFAQRPQFQLSDVVSMQLPLQYVRLDAHFETQLPALHFWSCGHALPHVPQLMLSVSVKAHDCPHSVCPASTSQSHRPCTHCVLLLHALPQEPQLELSDVVSTHEVMHSVSPDAHAETHLPCEHRSPVGHGLPHPPQFFASALRLLHVLPQSVCPVPHAQLPMRQVAPPPHWTPQPPQLLRSVSVFTHATPQNVRLSLGHDSVHTPLTQGTPCGHPPHASVFDDDFFEEHPDVGKSVAAATATTASTMDDRTRLLVWFDMTSGRTQQAGCLPSSSGHSWRKGARRGVRTWTRTASRTARTPRSSGRRRTP